MLAEPMDKPNRKVCVGVIAGPHGVDGRVRVKSFTAEPDGVTSYGPVTDASGAREFTLEPAGSVRGMVLARISGIRDRNAAEALRGVELYVERDRLPPPDEDEFYHADLIGLAVKDRTGAMIGAGIGGLPAIEEQTIVLHERGPRRVSPHFIPSALINLVSGQVQIRYGYKGPNHSVVTACSTGAHAIGDAARLIALDDADVMVAGGAEAAICRIGLAGFAQAKALSTNFNDEPTRASRPWDKDRDGFVMGEGAGIVILEELEHAKQRGAKIYAEVVGYGLSGDAHHVTAPAPDGDGGFRAMQAALKRAGLDPSDIDYINAHGTSTPLGDEIELGAVKRLFGNAAAHLSMSSTKSAIGHLLGAAGSVEAIFSILAMNHNVAPPTLNLDAPSDGCDGVDLVPHQAREREINAVLSNSFGFGGTNASVIFKAVE